LRLILVGYRHVSTLSLTGAGAIGIVVLERVFLLWIAPSLPRRPLHDADFLTCVPIRKQKPRRICGPLQHEAALVKLLRQPIRAPRRVRVGYRIAQDLGKPGFGCFGCGFLVGEPAFDRLG
jgi:hypothetical protein